MNKMKTKVLHSLAINLISLFLSIVITLLIPLTALADYSYEEEIALLKERIGEIPIGECQETLVQAYDLELTEFLKFLKTNFENKSANSTLVNIAIQRYSEYKIRLQNMFGMLQADVIASGDSNQYRRELESYGNCRIVMDDYIALAKTKMIEHIKNTSSKKKTTIMLEKYGAINERLADLNLAMAHVYANFVQFKNKLPFFNKNCVTN